MEILPLLPLASNSVQHLKGPGRGAECGVQRACHLHLLCHTCTCSQAIRVPHWAPSGALILGTRSAPWPGPGCSSYEAFTSRMRSNDFLLLCPPHCPFSLSSVLCNTQHVVIIYLLFSGDQTTVSNPGCFYHSVPSLPDNGHVY